jgi:hypothetical protein
MRFMDSWLAPHAERQDKKVLFFKDTLKCIMQSAKSQEPKQKTKKIHRVRRAYFVAYSGAPPVNGTGWDIFPWADLLGLWPRCSHFAEWCKLAADRDRWRLACGGHLQLVPGTVRPYGRN